MLNRLIILVSIMLCIYLVILYLRKKQLNTVKLAASNATKDTPNPVILYFWSPQCQHCKITQKPILEQLQASQYAPLKLHMINIQEQPDKAINWGVRTVPTTYILDAAGNIAHINNGIATEAQLRKQLDTVTEA